MKARCMNFHEHLIVGNDRRVDVTQAQKIKGAILVMHNRFHSVLCMMEEPRDGDVIRRDSSLT